MPPLLLPSVESFGTDPWVGGCLTRRPPTTVPGSIGGGGLYGLVVWPNTGGAFFDVDVPVGLGIGGGGPTLTLFGDPSTGCCLLAAVPLATPGGGPLGSACCLHGGVTSSYLLGPGMVRAKY